MSYRDIKTSKDFVKYLKEVYTPTEKQVERFKIEEMKFLAVEGEGKPMEKDFQEAIQILYGLAYALKMGWKYFKLKRPAGYFDFQVPPLETLWQDLSHWRALIMVPAFMTDVDLTGAKEQAETKKPGLAWDKAKFEEWKEGEVIQTLHIGKYSEENETVQRLMNYAKEQGLKINGWHHEIYLSDPKRTIPEKLKTGLRYPITA